jgi:hypothetical protein
VDVQLLGQMHYNKFWCFRQVSEERTQKTDGAQLQGKAQAGVIGLKAIDQCQVQVVQVKIAG